MVLFVSGFLCFEWGISIFFRLGSFISGGVEVNYCLLGSGVVVGFLVIRVGGSFKFGFFGFFILN